jgi:hypothetical protein
MAVNILTNEDLQHFKLELFAELKGMFTTTKEQPKRWLKSEEVKKILKVSPGTLQTLRINGTLQYTKIGGIIYYDFEHIQKTMEKNLRSASS